MSKPTIVILCGGESNEAEISRLSASGILRAIKDDFKVRFIDLVRDEVPDNIDPKNELVFPVMHGKWGEDGQMQCIMDQRGIQYIGSGQEASEICMDKTRAKEVFSQHGIRVCKQVRFTDPSAVNVDEVLDFLGDQLVIKPNAMGSSLHLHLIENRKEFVAILAQLDPMDWLIEERIYGDEIAVGILGGKAMGLVRIITEEGAPHDFDHKYTAGITVHEYPAKISEALTQEIKKIAETAFKACGCQDMARLDFMVDGSGNPFLLELNTLPGCTPTSMYPDSAKCVRHTYESLFRTITQTAVDRFLENRSHGKKEKKSTNFLA